jgi:hypothetical protein
MHRKVSLGFVLAAGLLGGVFARYLTPPAVLAQAQVLKEIKAQSFVLTDEKGNIVGTIKSAPPLLSDLDSALRPKPPGVGIGESHPTIVLLDRDGHIIWRADAVIEAKTTEDNSK